MAVYTYNFNAANTTAGTIPTPAGLPTLEQVSGSWQISSNRAYTSTARTSNPILAITSGGGDVDLSASISSGGGDAIYVRVLNSTNWFRARVRTYQTTSSYTYYVTEYEYKIQLVAPSATPPASHSHTNWNTYWLQGSPPISPGLYHSHDGYHHEHTQSWYATGNSRQSARTSTSTNTNYQIILERSINGTVTNLGSANVSNPSSLRVRAQGTSLQVFYNGGTSAIISTNDATNATTARHGIGRGTSDLDGQALDNMSVDTLNTAPNAPTGLTPNSGTLDVAATHRLDWNFSDPDTGDSQSKYDLQYRVVGAASWTTLTATTANTYRDMVAGTFSPANYEWRVRTYDSQGVVGPYSASAFFSAAAAPAGPTITDPINGAVVSTNPYTISWSTPEQDAYEVRTVADATGAPNTEFVYETTGTIESSSTRSQVMPFDTNSRTEHVQVRVRYAGLWSSWTSISVTVSYTAPSLPQIIAQPDDSAEHISVLISNPTTPGGLNLPGANGHYASTPDADDLDITGDIDIRACASLDQWAAGAEQTLVCKETSLDARAYAFRVLGGGSLNWIASGDGTTFGGVNSTAAVGFAAGTKGWVRVTWRASDGRTQFFTSLDGTSWTQLGADTTNAIGSIATNDAPLEIGHRMAASYLSGVVHSVEVRDGIDGTAVFDVDFTDESQWTVGDTDGAIGEDATGKVVTIHGAGSTIITEATAPDVVSNEVWVRVAVEGRQDIDRTVNDDGIRIGVVAKDGAYIDRAVASGVDYQYRVKAIGANDVATYSAWHG